MKDYEHVRGNLFWGKRFITPPISRTVAVHQALLAATSLPHKFFVLGSQAAVHAAILSTTSVYKK
jgi:hypothetical protein